MMSLLQKGHHPDTDPAFWNDWHPAPAPTLEMPWLPDFIDSVTRPSVLGAFFVFYLPIGGIITACLVSKVQSMRKAKKTLLQQQEQNISDLAIYK